MVGTRHPTYAGKDNAARLCGELVACGLAITSGLALGIDGGVISRRWREGDYPGRAGPRARLPLSEAPSGVWKSWREAACLSPSWHPTRDRWPSTFHGVIASSVACRWVLWWSRRPSRAGRSSRPVMHWNRGERSFAVPGAPQNVQALGCNKLIQQGAKLVLSAADIVEELPGFVGLLQQVADLSEHSNNSELPYADLLDNVDYETTSVDTVAERSQLPVEVVLGRLVELELAGAVMAVAGGYVRARRANHV